MKRTTLFLVLMAAAVSVALFVVKYRVQDLDDQLYGLTRDITATEENIHVLKSEWSHLNQPDRLRQLAARYLEIGPMDAAQIGAARDALETLRERSDGETASDPEVAQ